jgi:hypothetical protein
VHGKEEIIAGGVNLGNFIINNLKEDAEGRGTTATGFARLFI